MQSTRLLLASTPGRARVAGFPRFEVPWLEAMLVVVALYIVAGTIAPRRGRTAGVRTTECAMALLAFARIVSVAMTQHLHGWPAGGLA